MPCDSVKLSFPGLLFQSGPPCLLHYKDGQTTQQCFDSLTKSLHFLIQSRAQLWFLLCSKWKWELGWKVPCLRCVWQLFSHPQVLKSFPCDECSISFNWFGNFSNFLDSGNKWHYFTALADFLLLAVWKVGLGWFSKKGYFYIAFSKTFLSFEQSGTTLETGLLTIWWLLQCFIKCLCLTNETEQFP